MHAQWGQMGTATPEDTRLKAKGTRHGGGRDTAPLKWPMDQGFGEEGLQEEWGAQMGCRQGRAG